MLETLEIQRKKRGYEIVSKTGFPTGIDNMGGGDSSKFDEGAWVNTWGKHGRELETLSKNTCEGVHLLVYLPAISLQACKFTKNLLWWFTWPESISG